MSALRNSRVGWYLALASVAIGGLLIAVDVGSVGAAALRFAVPPAGDRWATFGHDLAHSGVSADRTIAGSTASGLTQRWSESLSSTIAQSSPAVAYNGKLSETLIFDVTYTGVVSAFNAETGALVWQRSIGSEVASSPAVYDSVVYFGTLDGTLEALSAATGTVRCTFTLPVIAPATNPGRLFSSPVVGDVDGTGPTVFIGDAGTGQSDNSGHVWAITGVGNAAGSCKQKWTYNGWPNKGTTGMLTGVWDEPALARNSRGAWEVVFGTSDPDQSVYALNAVNGSRLWRFHTMNTGPTNEDVGAGPTIGLPGRNGFADGVVYIDGKDGIEYALDLLTGKKIWSHTLGPGTGRAHGVSEAALTGNTLVVCYAASVFALNATTGAAVWDATLGATIHASPAVSGPAGDRVVFVGDLHGTEYGLDVQDGAQVFAAVTGGQLQASAVVADGMVYFTSGGTFYAYAPP
jgi:outer membrane protein assembly factor BamB